MGVFYSPQKLRCFARTCGFPAGWCAISLGAPVSFCARGRGFLSRCHMTNAPRIARPQESGETWREGPNPITKVGEKKAFRGQERKPTGPGHNHTRHPEHYPDRPTLTTSPR